MIRATAYGGGGLAAALGRCNLLRTTEFSRVPTAFEFVEDDENEEKVETELDVVLANAMEIVKKLLASLVVCTVLAAAAFLAQTALPIFASALAVAFLLKPTEASFASWYETERMRDATDRDDLIDKMISHAASVIDIQVRFPTLAALKTRCPHHLHRLILNPRTMSTLTRVLLASFS